MHQLHRRVFLIVSLAVLPGCSINPGVPGSGVPASEERDVGEFDSLTIIGSGDVVLTTGELTPLRIEADDNLLRLISTENRNGALRIEPPESVSPRIGPTIVLQSPSIAEITVTGSGIVDLSGLVSKSANVVMTGSGTTLVDATETLDATVVGSGQVRYSSEPSKSCRKQTVGSGTISLVPGPEVGSEKALPTEAETAPAEAETLDSDSAK